MRNAKTYATRSKTKRSNDDENPTEVTTKEGNACSIYDFDSSLQDEDTIDKGEDRKDFDFSQSIRKALVNATSDMNNQSWEKGANVEKFNRILSTVLAKIMDDQKTIIAENKLLKSRLTKVEEELITLKRNQAPRDLRQPDTSSPQQDGKSYATIVRRCNDETAKSTHGPSTPPRQTRRETSQGQWQTPKKQKRKKNKYNRRYKQNVVILELDANMMISEGSAERQAATPNNPCIEKKLAPSTSGEKAKPITTDTGGQIDLDAPINSEEDKKKKDTAETLPQPKEPAETTPTDKTFLSVGKSNSEITPAIIGKLGLTEFAMHKIFLKKYGNVFQGIQYKTRKRNHLKIFFRGSKDPNMDAHLGDLQAEHKKLSGSFFPSLFKFVTTIRPAISRPTNYSVVMKGPRLGPNEQSKAVRNSIIKQIVETSTTDVKIEAVEQMGKGPLVQLFVNSRDEVDKLLNTEITYQGRYLRIRAYENRRRPKHV